MDWIIGIVLLVIIGYLLDREIYFYEGVHLGPRVQAWLYDRWSRKYDEGKRESQLCDDEMLAQPLIDALKDIPEPFVLDFATGTGRLSYALLSRTEFHGRIIALDLSQGMLEQAASKLSRAERRDGDLSSHSRSAGGPDTNSNPIYASTTPTAPLSARVEFLRRVSLPLPFADASFDVVCALEVLELFPNMDEPLAEFSRVLRPGGFFLTSRGTEESGRKAKVQHVPEYTSLLERHGFESIQVTNWWKLFDRVTASKRGESNPVEKHHLQDVLKCSSCGQVRWERSENTLRCGNCNRELTVTKEGIALE